MTGCFAMNPSLSESIPCPSPLPFIPGKKPIQRGPGNPQLPRQRRLADFPALVAGIAPGQVGDGHRLPALVSPLPFGNGDSLPLAFQKVGPLIFVNSGDYCLPAAVPVSMFSLSETRDIFFRKDIQQVEQVRGGAGGRSNPFPVQSV